MNEKEREQRADLVWANDVLSGRGLSVDHESVAINMLRMLVEYGATEKIRRDADAALARAQAVA